MFEPKELFDYLKNPKYVLFLRKENVFLTALKSYLLYLLFVGLGYSIVYTVLNNIVDIPIDRAKQIPQFFENRKALFFLYFAILVPLAEEMLFRLPLRFSILNILIANMLLLISIALSFDILLSYIVLIGIVYLSFLFVLLRQFKNNIKNLWERRFPFIFYFLSIAFGLVHLSNFEIQNSEQIFIALILILPQLLLGVYLSFLRMYFEYGILITIIFHVFLNSVAFLVIF